MEIDMTTALPMLRKDGSSRNVTMSSAAACYGAPEEAVYSAPEFAVRGPTEALSIELESQGVWVCDVMVACVATPVVLHAKDQAKPVAILGVSVQPSQVADTVYQAVAGRQVHWFVTEADARRTDRPCTGPPESSTRTSIWSRPARTKRSSGVCRA